MIMRVISLSVLMILSQVLNASVFVDPYRQDVKYSQIKLDNGINVIIQQDPLTTMADVVFVVNAGSALDGKHQGLAHLLEHMMFQGSKKYPSVSGFKSFIDQAGGSTNAFTEPEYTLYNMSMNANSLKEGLDRFASTVADPMFDEKGIQKEKKSVHEEYLLSKNQDGFALRDITNRLIYSNENRVGFLLAH